MGTNRHQRRQSAAILASAAAMVCVLADRARAVDPTPLQTAYYKFEEGTDGAPVDDTNANAVIDSVNANHMRTFNAGTAPVYSSLVSTPINFPRHGSSLATSARRWIVTGLGPVVIRRASSLQNL